MFNLISITVIVLAPGAVVLSNWWMPRRLRAPLDPAAIAKREELLAEAARVRADLERVVAELEAKTAELVELRR